MRMVKQDLPLNMCEMDVTELAYLCPLIRQQSQSWWGRSVSVIVTHKEIYIQELGDESDDGS